MIWDHRRFGTAADPIRQSDLNDIASSYGCSKRFQLRKEQEHECPTERERASGRMAIGTAVHETIRLYLTHHRAKILAGDYPSEESVFEVLSEQIRSIDDVTPIDWYGDDPAKAGIEAMWMVRGALQDVAGRAAKILLVESTFTAPFSVSDKTYYTTGTIDLVFEDRVGRLVLADWKTGAQRATRTILNHGYQLGLYAHALKEGDFDGVKIDRYPDELYLVHLRDKVPYARKTTKAVDRVEEAEYWNVAQGAKVTLQKGDARGPAWYRAQRTEIDAARLRHSIRKLVSGVRLGVMYESIGEACAKCAYRDRCLSDGFGPDKDVEKRLMASLDGVDLDGLDNVA